MFHYLNEHLNNQSRNTMVFCSDARTVHPIALMLNRRGYYLMCLPLHAAQVVVQSLRTYYQRIPVISRISKSAAALAQLAAAVAQLLLLLQHSCCCLALIICDTQTNASSSFELFLPFHVSPALAAQSSVGHSILKDKKIVKIWTKKKDILILGIGSCEKPLLKMSAFL